MTLKKRIHDIIFEAETREGKLFDVILLIMIFASIIIVSLETVKEAEAEYGKLFHTLEWIFTFFFTIEYFMRLWVVKKKTSYALSFYGIIDLLSILPAYLSIFFVGSQSLIVIRTLRLLRIFRILKMGHFLTQGRVIRNAVIDSKEKVFVFLFFVFNVVVVLGSMMYLIEGDVNDSFTSIPRTMYWAIVTLTTVGYGDITPITPMGQFLASIIMILGYAVIAVPTGIVTNELMKSDTKKVHQYVTHHCDVCGNTDHEVDALFCKLCGNELHPEDDHDIHI